MTRSRRVASAKVAVTAIAIEASVPIRAVTNGTKAFRWDTGLPPRRPQLVQVLGVLRHVRLVVIEWRRVMGWRSVRRIRAEVRTWFARNVKSK